MEARKVSAINGWLWIKQGYGLFRKSPLLWVSLTAIGMIGMLGLASAPVVGDPLATLLFPIVLAGYMLGCRALAQGEELELAHLFAGFRQQAQQLVTLGGIGLVAQLLILGVMKLTGGAELVDILMSGKQVDDPAVLLHAMEGAGMALLLGMALFSLLMMATQFAPMLVIFGRMMPVPAMKTSLRAFLRNILPLTVYGVMLLPFALLASLPMMLGWLVLMPVVIASMYATYSDLFPMQPETPRAAEGEAVTPGDQGQS
ncbi:MAG: hypothetical protein HY938_11525 [Nitrosomonadales bacterium]|nr:hypothetical protein [Nitrosomonadales bacterium]